MAHSAARKKIIELSEEQIRVVEDQVDKDLMAVEKGKLEDAVLLQSMAENWSYDQFMKVSQQRGRNYGVLSALADRTIEIQGIATLHLVSDVMRHGLREATVRKAIAVYRRLKELMEEYEDDPIPNQIIADAMEEVIEQARETRASFQRAIGRLLS